jgi:hypothetical protein
MLVYTAEPSSPSAEALRILASWTSPAAHAARPEPDTEAR